VIKDNYSLRLLNSFGLNICAKYFFETNTDEDLFLFVRESYIENQSFLILGEGSNILFTGDYDGMVVHPDLKGIEILDENDVEVNVKVYSGENWDEFVRYTVEKGWGGLENLSFIPGSVGACPVQNIGAYGVEVKDRIIKLEGINIPEKSKKSIFKKECKFSYRSSIFKEELKNRFIITSVTFRLDKNPSFELGYGLVKQEFLKKSEQSLSALRQTIIDIRERKLPDPKKYGNAGSFFKNPVIKQEVFKDLQQKYTDIPSYPAGDGYMKIPAAWLIEKAGWKGIKEGNTGSYAEQPLVIVNYGGASGREILEFSMKIQDTVRKMFGIELQREVNVV
jgi:UDP-N-acetylmuramate dehydrogenase